MFPEDQVGFFDGLAIKQAGTHLFGQVETVGEVLAPPLAAVTPSPPFPYPSISVPLNRRLLDDGTGRALS